VVAVVRGPGEPETDLRSIGGAVAGLTMLAPALVIGRNDRWLPIGLALAVLLLSGTLSTAALTWWSVVRRRLPETSVRWFGQYRRTLTRIRVRALDSTEFDLRLIGTPDHPLDRGATIRLPRKLMPRKLTSGRPARVRRIEVLAGPDGPPVGVVLGRQSVATRLARATAVLGYLTCAAVLILLIQAVR
jgi:hypothetical protein